jgi:15-hydroxyprostaglandin dehydrogenase (NAD)
MVSVSSPTSKHAIVTGGASGIGLSLVKHLLKKPEWKIIVADIRPEAWKAVQSSLDSERTIFVQTDVTSWESQVALFKKAEEWSQGRIDFFAANAGIADKDSFYAPTDLEKEPQKPNMICVDVCETAVFYGLQLMIYYTRKTNQALKASSDSPAAFNPKMVITASCAGLYVFPLAPQYNAAKHAVVALARSVGPALLAMDNLAVNCICPAFVATPLMPDSMTSIWPKEYLTPYETMLRAYDELIDDNGGVQQDGKSDGEDGVVKTGRSVECALDKLYYRKPVDFADESQKFLIEDAHKPDGLWMQGSRKAVAEGLLPEQPT